LQHSSKIIHYEEKGVWSTIGFLEPPPCNDLGHLLILMHGLGSSKAGYKRSFVSFSKYAVTKGFHVFRFDLPGFGESVVYDASMDNINSIAGPILYLREHYGFRHISLVGHCLGGALGLKVLWRNTGMVDSIVLWDMYESLANSSNFTGIMQFLDMLRKYMYKLTNKETLQKIARFNVNYIRIFRILFRSFKIKRVRTGQNKKIQGAAYYKPASNRCPVLLINDDTRPKSKTISAKLQHRLKKAGHCVDSLVLSQKSFSLEWKKNVFKHTIEWLVTGHNKLNPGKSVAGMDKEYHLNA
jgi:pimeloyl-ACP methyl ester carboxylesterase